MTATLAVRGKQRQRIIPAGWKTTERTDNKEERGKRGRLEINSETHA